jgi:hypothetical protein
MMVDVNGQQQQTESHGKQAFERKTRGSIVQEKQALLHPFHTKW